ncbi:MAG: ABC transporter permease subunit [Candidatus Acidiferrales bacterium]
MKIQAIALNTFGSFLRNRLLIVFLIIFICVVLLMMSPMLAYKAMTTSANAEQMQTVVLGQIASIMYLVSGFGSLLAAWAAADSVASEMKSGTILAVMARPVCRWEFLVGKYAGVQLLMCVYVSGMVGLSYLLAWLGGERIQSSVWVLFVYPLVRYSIYSAIALALVTLLHPAVTMGIIAMIALLAVLLVHASNSSRFMWRWLRNFLYVILPSTNLLSEDRFLTITKASLKKIAWTGHLTTLAYGLDYALVVFLLAAWSFHYRALTRD